MATKSTQTFALTLRTPEGNLYEGNIRSVAFMAEGGQVQLMAHHASFTGTIAFSRVILELGETQEIFIVRNGLFLFNNSQNRATLLALHGEQQSEISHQTATEYLQFIEEQLAKGADLSEFQLRHLQGEKFAVEQQLKG